MDRATEEILEIFASINSIPRCSGHEGKIANWLKEWAVSNGLSVKFDTVNNILITVPGSPGCKKLPAIVLQGHMDMVCEKVPDSDHDFSKDPIAHVIDGDWLKADGTSLGADNGIALAIALRLATDKDLRHPPLELLFTVDEETGLTGANELTGDFISGKILLNLDSEDEGIFIIGCAGGLNTNILLPLEYEPIPEDQIVCRLLVDGLTGGHSGVDIHEKRGNANKILAKTLLALLNEYDIKLLDIKGGSAHNAIPRHAEALVALSFDSYDDTLSLVRKMEGAEAAEYSECDPMLSITLSLDDSSGSDQSLNGDMSKRAIDLLMELPHGVIGMSSDVSGLVETSSNLATVGIEDGKLMIVMSQRSSVSSELEMISAKIKSMADAAGATVTHEGGYSAWQPDTTSELLERCKRVYTDMFSKEADIEVIHAGLECAVIGSKFPEMDMISFGPTIKNPHSPDERLYIPSILDVWNFLVGLLASYSDKKNNSARKSAKKTGKR
ncbi:aminoacyl-histidine dipeptidase [Methanolobus sp. ZRKC3]|uniref:aminoacyl-histidine dipeptidase n=1 Tax=Methanolobus sp. ZRKC3 TaxID=3125786 RepID=UPI00324C6329